MSSKTTTASKRLLATLTVRHGRLVKSYGYAAWRPAGDLCSALRNLDRWAADEILVLDISRRPGLDPVVLEAIARAKISTPLAYGGGIRSREDLLRLMDLGCDRFVVETLLYTPAGQATLATLATLAGRQALVGAVPVRPSPATPGDWLLASPQPDLPPLALAEVVPLLLSSPVSEYLIISAASEGRPGAFPAGLTDAFSALPLQSALWFGGLDEPAALACLGHAATAGVALGHPFLEKELALPLLRAALLRAPSHPPLRRVRTVRS